MSKFLRATRTTTRAIRSATRIKSVLLSHFHSTPVFSFIPPSTSGNNEPVLRNIGPNALIAFYTVEDGKCAVQVLTWQRADTEAVGASRSRLTLNPEQQMNIDSIEDSFTLQCGKDASNIMLIPPVLSAGFGTAK
jgi:hypothetical protein